MIKETDTLLRNNHITVNLNYSFRPMEIGIFSHFIKLLFASLLFLFLDNSIVFSSNNTYDDIKQICVCPLYMRAREEKYISYIILKFPYPFICRVI